MSFKDSETKQNTVNNNSSFNSNTENIKENNSSSLIENDKACKEIVESNDYYKIFNVNEDVTEEDLKKAYKKIIVKYHPDKNKSEHAPEAFKKISHAFQILNDPEKREIYDNFGTEEEIKKRASNKEETNEFDLFDLIINNNRNIRYKKNKEPEQKSVLSSIISLLFSVVMFYFFNSGAINNNSSSNNNNIKDYDFEGNNKRFPHEGSTKKNNVKYFFNDNYEEKVKELSLEDLETYDDIIEKNYLGFLSEKCQNELRRKYEIEYKLATSNENIQELEEDLDNIDYYFCDYYEDLKEKIN